MKAAFINGQPLFKRDKNTAFTLVELLVVILVIVILVIISVVLLNLGEVYSSTRDTTRIQDLQSLNKRIMLYQMNGNTSFGSSNTVYISLPDSNANCSSYTLPTLPSGWSYACKPEASYRNIDGTGWVPIDLSNSNTGTSGPKLQIDPTNSASNRYYYSYYVSNNVWELNAQMEARANQLAGSSDKVSTDGGDDFTRFEIGPSLVIAPWNFEFTALPTATNNSGLPGWYASSANGTVSINSDSTSTGFLESTGGQRWYIWQENIPFDSNATYVMTCKVRQLVDPTVGGKGFFCGWTGVGSDGVTLVNINGVNSYSSQHYQTMSNAVYTAGTTWNSRTGYTKGWGSPNGTTSGCTNSATPCKMHQDVRYIRPMFIMNYSAGNGTADIDSITVTKQ